MFREIPQLRPIVTSKLQSAIHQTIDDWRERAIEQEPVITERLNTRVQDALNGIDLPGVHFSVVTFNDRGRGSEEKQYGADIAGFMAVNYPDGRQQRKFFLAQAKIGQVERDGSITLRNLSKGEAERLVGQIEAMLKITKETYVIIYTQQAFVFVPAISIAQTRLFSPDDYWYTTNKHVAPINAATFYTWNFGCYVGDKAVQQKVGFPVDTADDLKNAVMRLNAKTGQLLNVILLGSSNEASLPHSPGHPF